MLNCEYIDCMQAILCGHIIINIFKLRVYLYFQRLSFSLLEMNLGFYSVFIFERLINISGVLLIYIAIYIR